MTGAMYAAIAGLRTHMQNLNVIGNNIANVNTFGYKPGRSIFRSALYTQISSGSDGTTTTGGKNPSQIGYGANLSTVGIDMSTGTYSPGNSMDCMIDGDGFFLISDKATADTIDPANPESFKSLTLTRVGDIDFGPDNYLENGNGDVVYGFLVVGVVDGEPIFSDQLVPIRGPRQDENGNIMYPHLEQQGGADGKLVLTDTVRPADGGAGGGAAADANLGEYTYAQLDSVSISEKTGLITGIVKGTNEKITIGAIAIGNVTNPNGVTQMSNTYYRCDEGTGDLSVSLLGGLGEDIYVYNGGGDMPNTLAAAGDIVTKGMRYVNGSQYDGDNDTPPRGSQVFSAGTTKLMTGGLELSKTDLATEIANMITTQRGYQANTRIITVTDSMLEELVNMKR